MSTNMETAADIVVTQPIQPPMLPAHQATPDALLIYAMDKGADLDRLEKLMELKTRFEADQARKAYVVDMTAFKKNPPRIIKDKAVGFESRDGTSTTSYWHATLGSVTKAIVDALAEHGFSHRWDTKVEGVTVTVTCIITHRLGHSESTTLSSGNDTSGKKNSIQAMASAMTYLQRYTLLAATGLATHDQPDDDGKGAEDISADRLIADAFRARDMQSLQNLWDRGSKILRTDDWVSDDYPAFKAAVNAAKALLPPAQPVVTKPNASTRLSGIVGGAKPKTADPVMAGAPADPPPWDDQQPGAPA